MLDLHYYHTWFVIGQYFFVNNSLTKWEVRKIFANEILKLHQEFPDVSIFSRHPILYILKYPYFVNFLKSDESDA